MVYFHILCVVIWTLPVRNELTKPNVRPIGTDWLLAMNLRHVRTQPWVKAYLFGTGTWQYWDMFAPTPRSDDVKVEVVYLTGDGERHSVFLTDMRSMGYFERWQKERWRKYFNDNLRTDAQRYLWEPFAVFFARELTSGGITPVQIELIRHWRSAEKPFGPHLRGSIKSSPWNKYTFYVWRAESQRDPVGRHGG